MGIAPESSLSIKLSIGWKHVLNRRTARRSKAVLGSIVSLCIQLGIAKHAPTVCDRGYIAARNILYSFLYECAFAERPRPFHG
ncbi:hypothetical protein SeLEV6574_g06322 [Synchytrium endobioticum]|uniref:Uncharacterized protein n=1 Tax=Synchytrium endobioticum TaxID=286115 RepID=A0A507CP96_9FUNG|nr:hypothetical protein SeLEV6574_g06322 [Synchytrium endobioticum]